MNTMDAKCILEAVLLCTAEPLGTRELMSLFDGAFSFEDVEHALKELQHDWSGRHIRLVRVANGWRFQSQPELREYLNRLSSDKPLRYSRAVLETLAVIAYRQPVTRGDVEDIRGVAVNSLLLKQLEDRGWVEIVGHRQSIGKPALFSTTRQFLDDIGLASLGELPPFESVPFQFAELERLELALQATYGIQPAFAQTPSVDMTPLGLLASSNEKTGL